MTGASPAGSGPGGADRDGVDPVVELFARERGEIVDAAADDLRWQRIVRAARAERRSRGIGRAVAGLAAAAATVAAVLVGTAVLRADDPAVVAQTEPTGTPVQVTSGTTPSPSNESLAPTATGSGSPTLDAPVVKAVPAGFQARSVSNAGNGFVYVLGSSACSDGECPMLVGSGDSGKSWSLVKTFPTYRPAAAVDAPQQRSAAPARSALSQVRFANAKVGWVFGGGALMTRDGGATWQPFAHPGEVLLDLETKGSSVYLATASGCDAAACTSGYQVTVAPLDPVSGNAPTTGASTVPTSGGTPGTGTATGSDQPTGNQTDNPVNPPTSAPTGTASVAPQAMTATGAPVKWALTAADVTVAGSVPFVTVTGTSSGELASARVDQSSVSPVPSDGEPAVRQVVGSADGSATVHGFALDGDLVKVSRSTDGGTTWTTAGEQALRLAGARHFAAATSRDLVAATGGTADSADVAGTPQLLVSHDGGATWAAPAVPPAARAGWHSVTATGDGGYDAVENGAEAAYWHSDDHGRTWTRTQLRP